MANQSTFSGSRFDQQYIAILDDVFFAFGQDFAFGSDRRLVTLLPKGRVVVDDGLDERFLKV